MENASDVADRLAMRARSGMRREGMGKTLSARAGAVARTHGVIVAIVVLQPCLCFGKEVKSAGKEKSSERAVKLHFRGLHGYIGYSADLPPRTVPVIVLLDLVADKTGGAKHQPARYSLGGSRQFTKPRRSTPRI